MESNYGPPAVVAFDVYCSKCLSLRTFYLIFIAFQDIMMDFNLDYIAHRKPKPHRQIPTKPPIAQQTKELADRLIALCNVKYHAALRTAFTRIQFSRRLRVQKLALLEQYILRRKEISFLAIKRYVSLSAKSQQLSEKNSLNLPIAIIRKVHEGGKLRCLNWGMEKLRETRRWFDEVKMKWGQIGSLCYRYQKRAFLA